MGFPIVTTAVVVLTTIVSYRGFQDPWFRSRYMFDVGQVRHGRQWYRLVTGGLPHLDWLHLLFNMLALYFFGDAIELSASSRHSVSYLLGETIVSPHLYGIVTLLAVYFGGIVGGHLLSLTLHRYQDSYRALGASGGVSGLVLAYIFLFPGSIIRAFMLIPLPGWLYAILFIVLTFVALRNQWRGTGHDAHLGGAIVGLLIATALHPTILLDNLLLYAIIMGLVVILFVDLRRNPLYLPGASPFHRAYWRGRRARWQALWTARRAQGDAEQEVQDKQDLDRLLLKISRSGIESLTWWEQRKLKGISKRMRDSGRIH